MKVQDTQIDQYGRLYTRETLSSVKVEKNSRGVNWEIKLYFDEHLDTDRDFALKTLKELETKLTIMYGPKEGGE